MSNLVQRISQMSPLKLAFAARELRSKAALLNAEPIAIIGMACRFPGAPSLDAFWDSLRRGHHAVRELPPDRWRPEAWLDEAERLFRQALELTPNHPRVSASFASFLADHQLQLDEALALADRAVRAQPDNPEFLDSLGWVQAQRGDLDAAERTLQRALKFAGEEPPAEEIRRHLGIVRERRASPTR